MTVDLRKMQNLLDQVRVKATGATNEVRGGKWWNIKNANDTAEVYIYDFIGEWGVTAQDFVSELRDVTSSSIELHISSKGGEVWDALTIYEALQRHPAKVTTYVDALAASAASFIAMAGERIVMARNARMMIHDARVGVGIFSTVNAAEIRELASDMQAMATLMDDVSDNIADVYAQRAGKDVAYWRDQMRNGPGGDRWYTAQQAVDAGLADEVSNTDDDGSTSNSGTTRNNATQSTINWDSQAFLSSLKDAFKQEAVA